MSEVTRGLIVRVGVDLAKRVIQVHAVDASGRAGGQADLGELRRSSLVTFFWATRSSRSGGLLTSRSEVMRTPKLPGCRAGTRRGIPSRGISGNNAKSPRAEARGGAGNLNTAISGTLCEIN